MISSDRGGWCEHPPLLSKKIEVEFLNSQTVCCHGPVWGKFRMPRTHRLGFLRKRNESR